MQRREWRFLSAVLLWVALFGTVARAQEPITLRADLIFYGDNTEFRNPFREGETIFGTAVRATVVVGIADRAELTLGALTNQRFGSGESFELVRPVVSLRLGGPRSAFIFGTLPRAEPGQPPGPDRTGPHKLLPALQRETLAFDRPYEAGLQWNLAVGRVEQSAWMDWQRLNTPAHRERFDTGLNGRILLNGYFSIPYQLHVVHDGGQLFATGPVTDNFTGAIGVSASTVINRIGYSTLELYALGSSDTPDRERPALSRDGAAFLGRASTEAAGWRAHILFWRGREFIAREGDPNYQSIRRDGHVYGGIRDYSEAGLTRTFEPARGVLFEASGRLHRVEKHYEYSYRVLATVNVDWKLR